MAQILATTLCCMILINSSCAESCSESPCEHDGVCTTIDASNVDCSCTPGYTGQHCKTPVAGLWTPMASVECDTACEAFNSTPVITGYQSPNIPFYICAALYNGYRTGFKKHGQPDCFVGPQLKNYQMFNCLCEGRMVWVSASGGLRCADACAEPVSSGSHAYFAQWSFSTKPFYACRTFLVDGHKIGGSEQDSTTNHNCLYYGYTGGQSSGKDCLCHGESCSQAPCQNNGFCSTVDVTTVHCSCQPDFSGHHCDIKVSVLWAPEGTTECDAACEDLGSSPVIGGYDQFANTTLYICAGFAYGHSYRGGYKRHGQPNCLVHHKQVTTQFRCLCKGQKNLEWISASKGTGCSDTCKNPVVTGSHKFSAASYSRMPFHLCRSTVDGYMQVGFQLNEHTNDCTIYPDHRKVNKECLCYKESVVDNELCDRYNGLHIQNNETYTNSCFVLLKNAYNYEDSSSLCNNMATGGWHGRLAILADDRVFKAVREGLTDLQSYPVWTGFRTKDTGNNLNTWKWYDGDEVVFNHTDIPGVQVSLTTDSYECAYLDLSASPPKFAEYNCLNIRYLLCEFVFGLCHTDNVNLVNAYGTSSGWKYKERDVEVNCTPGHRLDGNISAESSTSRCMSGTWSPSSIICREVCDTDNLEFENGGLNATGLIFDKEAVEFSCGDDMVLAGDESKHSSVVHCNGSEWIMVDGNLTCVKGKPVQVFTKHFKTTMGQLVNEELLELTGIRNPIECGGRCLMMDGCVSFNYFEQSCSTEGNKGKCQLNGKRRRDVTAAKFLTTPDVIYGEIVQL